MAVTTPAPGFEVGRCQPAVSSLVEDGAALAGSLTLPEGAREGAPFRRFSAALVARDSQSHSLETSRRSAAVISTIPLTPTTIPPRRPFVSTSMVSLLACLVLAWGIPFAPVARAQDDDEQGYAATSPDDETDNRDPAESARVRFLEGDLKIEREDNDHVDVGSLNAPVFAGDIVTTAHGRGEVQLASGAIVRLDENTRVTFLSLPGGGGDVDTVVQVSEGSASVDVHGALSRRKDFRLDTPSASVYLLASGRYRIDVEGKYKKTRASAVRGVAEVVGDDGSVILRSGQRTLVGESGEPESPRSFNTAAVDEFDGWVLDRSEHYRVASDGPDSRSDSGPNGGSYGGDDSYEPDQETLPEQVRPYGSELSYYGSWSNVAPYGNVWIPGGVSVGWRPYYNGYWSYGAGGNFWVSYDPWGWAPYHYGRWVFATGHWCWIPGGVFSPAWVSWYYGPSYFGWCPLDYWNYPCALRYGYTGYDFHCWNFVGYHNIYHRNVRRVYASPTAVRIDLNKGVVVRGRPVPIRPTDISSNRIAPPLILQKARDMKLSRIDVNAERVSKRSFRDGEREQIARQSPGMRRMSPGDGRDARAGGRPTAPGREDKGSGPAREGRGQGSRGSGREGSPTKQRPAQPESPRLHGPGRPSDNDKNRGHGGGGSHKPSQRSATSDELLPGRPRMSSGYAERRPGPPRARGETGFEERAPLPYRPRGSGGREMMPNHPRGESGFSDSRPTGRGAEPGGRSDRRLMDVFRESGRGPQRGPDGGSRGAPQGRPSPMMRPGGESRSQPHASRPPSPPPQAQRSQNDHKKR
jgi:hypothetical protein